MTTNAPIEGQYEEPTYDRDTGEVRTAAPLATRPEPAAPAVRAPAHAALRPEAPAPQPRPGPRMSDATDQLFAALAAAQMAFGEVRKTRTADVRSTRGAYSYKYANLADVMEAIRVPLRDNGLVPMQIPMGDRVYVRIVHGPSGQWIEGGLPLALPDYGSDIQRLGSALTYMRRYLLTMMLGIVAEDEDDDGASAQGQPQRGPRAA